MTVPVQIYADLAALQAQTSAASPLSSASSATITAIQLNSENLVSEIEAAQASAAGKLDTWTAPMGPEAIISGILGLVQNANDQWVLTDMLAFTGRVNLNLMQL